MEPILQALDILFSPGNFGLLLMAVFAGIVVGAVPGLTSAVAIGLLIPFTFSFDQFQAFILLLGIYVGSMYGGSIPAILMNLPGTPTSAVTAIEGYPLSRKGEAGAALGVSVFSGATGGVIGCLFLIFLSLELSAIAVEFGGPEYFTLSLFAIVLVFSLASDDLLKGALAAGLGLLLATIGMDDITPYPRFTFGIDEIMIGVPIVPATIGLFCVAEGFRMMQAPGRITDSVADITGITAIYRHLPRLWRTIVRSSFIGTFIGVLPGAGATIGSYMSYQAAKARSPRPTWGKGELEGVAASESANNALTGGALIPLLTLGIPGDINTLLLIGAMFVHGLVPGPTLFKDELVLVYVIFATMVMSNLLILFFGAMMTKWIAKVSSVDRKHLAPLVLVVAIAGPAISYGHVYYFWVAVVFGLIGYFSDKGGFPPLAIAMSLILGPIMEYNLRASLMLPDAGVMTFLKRPISAMFIFLTFVAFGFGLRRELKRRRARQNTGKLDRQETHG